MTRTEIAQFYFSPVGRVARQAYWFRLFLPVLALNLALAAVEGRWTAEAGASVWSSVLNAALLPPFLIVTYKRFKDRSFGPRHFAGFIGVIVGAVIIGRRAVAAGQGTVGIIAFTVLAMAVPAFLYLVLALPSQAGANAYGPDPRPDAA
ncbi:MAG: DUF805 domain-containing protein [Pseudomonadota bacterium]